MDFRTDQQNEGARLDLGSIRRQLNDLHGDKVTSPFYAEVRLGNLAWIERHNLAPGSNQKDRLTLFDCAQFSSLSYSDFPKEHVSLGADLIAWLFLFDDYFGEARLVGDRQALGELFDNLMAFWREDRPEPASCRRFAIAMKDILDRGSAISPPGWGRAFLESMKLYFDGCLLEYTARESGQTPNLDTYEEIRELSIGAYPVFDLIDSHIYASVGKQYPQVSHPSLLEARRIAALMCVWINDIYSWEKERREQDVHNIIYVMGSDLLPFDPNLALHRTCTMHQTYYKSLESLMTAPGLPPVIKRQIRALKNWVDGCFHWTSQSERYSKFDESFLTSSLGCPELAALINP